MSIVYLVGQVDLISGGMRVIFQHVNELLKNGHTVEVWTTGTSLEPSFDNNVPVSAYSQHKLDQPDVVVMTDPSFIFDCTRSRSSKKTLLLLQHDNEWIEETTGMEGFSGAISENIALFQSGKWEIITVSHWLQSVISQKYGVNSKLVPNGIDTSLFKPTRPVLRLNRPTALLYYDPQEWKGYQDAARAALLAKTYITDLSVMLIGRYFPEGIKESHMHTGFSFPAFYFARPDQHDFAGIYSSASVFVSASWQEGFGLPGLEAMSCGVPLVTTDSGGPSDYAQNNVTALVVPPKNIEKLAEAIISTLTDTVHTELRVKNGKKLAKQFTLEKSSEKLVQIMQEAYSSH